MKLPPGKYISRLSAGETGILFQQLEKYGNWFAGNSNSRCDYSLSDEYDEDNIWSSSFLEAILCEKFKSRREYSYHMPAVAKRIIFQQSPFLEEAFFGQYKIKCLSGIYFWRINLYERNNDILQMRQRLFFNRQILDRIFREKYKFLPRIFISRWVEEATYIAETYCGPVDFVIIMSCGTDLVMRWYLNVTTRDSNPCLIRLGL